MTEIIHTVGKLCLVLDYAGEQEEMCVGLCEGEDPYDATSMAVYAEALAPFVADVLAGVYLVAGWRSKNPVGVRAGEGAFSGPFVGTHGTDSGTRPWRSLRACITGKTAFPRSDAPAGQTKVFLPLLNTLTVLAGDKDIVSSEDGPWQDLRAFLAGNGSLWSDYFGRKAMVRARTTIGFNSYLQDKRGS